MTASLIRVTRWTTLLMATVIIVIALIVISDIFQQIELTNQDYILEEVELTSISEEIKQNADYYYKSEVSRFERDVKRELLYLVNSNESTGDLSKFLHYRDIEDILLISDDGVKDLNPRKYFAEKMDIDEINYITSTLDNNLKIKDEGSFYYYWPEMNNNNKLIRKIVYYRDSGTGAVMTILFDTEDFNSIIIKQTKEWVENIYENKVLIYDLGTGKVVNNNIIENFNISRINMPTVQGGIFYREQNGSTIRIIHLSKLDNLDMVIASQITVTDYSSIFYNLLAEKKVTVSIIVGVGLIILIKIFEYFYIAKAINHNYFDKRLIYETLEYCTDGVAILNDSYLIEDCNEKFKEILGLDVFIKNTYYLKKIIPEFKFTRSSYNLNFMNKNGEYIDGNTIVKKIENKYIVKVKENNPLKPFNSLSFSEFEDVVSECFNDVEKYVGDRIFAMVVVDSDVKIDYLINKLKSYFSKQGITIIVGYIGSEERIVYLEGVSEETFENVIDNIINQNQKIFYSLIPINKDDFQLNINYLMEELDYKLYEKRSN